jgi:hypothetical protein
MLVRTDEEALCKWCVSTPRDSADKVCVCVCVSAPVLPRLQQQYHQYQQQRGDNFLLDQRVYFGPVGPEDRSSHTTLERHSVTPSFLVLYVGGYLFFGVHIWLHPTRAGARCCGGRRNRPP